MTTTIALLVLAFASVLIALGIGGLLLLRLLAILEERLSVLEEGPAKSAPEAEQVHFSFHQDW